MYGKNHVMFPKLKDKYLIPFSDTIKPIFRSQNDPRVILRFFPPLIETGMMWEPYTEEETNIMLVHPLKNREEVVEEENDTVDIPKTVKDKLVVPSTSSKKTKSTVVRKKTKTKKNNNVTFVDASSSEDLIPIRKANTTKRNNVILDSSSSEELLLPKKSATREIIDLTKDTSSSKGGRRRLTKKRY